MHKYVLVKVEYEESPRKIQAAEVKEERNRLIIYDGDKKVGQFPQDKIEHWSFDK